MNKSFIGHQYEKNGIGFEIVDMNQHYFTIRQTKGLVVGKRSLIKRSKLFQFERVR